MVALRLGLVDRRLSNVVGLTRVRARRDQHARKRQVALLGRHVECRLAQAVPGVYEDAAAQQPGSQGAVQS